MKRTALVCTLVLVVAGCATKPEPAVCSIDRLDWGIGQRADPPVVRDLYIQSGTGLWRIVMPGQAVRRDFRPDRLNIHVDANNTITGFSCG